MKDKLSEAFRNVSKLDTPKGPVFIYSLKKLEKRGFPGLGLLPFSIRILLEAILRNCDGTHVSGEDVASLARWNPEDPGRRELAFMPARVILQDFTGVPPVGDLAALRSAMVRMGGDANRVDPLIPVDLVGDHSRQVACSGSSDALTRNTGRESARNNDSYALLRWAQ